MNLTRLVSIANRQKSGLAANADPYTPILPQRYVNTTYSLPTGGTTWTVNNGGNLQTAINSAALGDVIVVEAGATFQGPFTLPNKTGTGWIYIISSALASLPAAGTRVSPANASNMPKITVTAGAAAPAISASSQSHHYRLVGLEVTAASSSDFIFNMIEGGTGTSVNANLPDNIVFDRCYVHGRTHATAAGRRGFYINGTNIAIIDSYVSGFYENGADSQAILIVQGDGPFKIVNNYLEAASENLMTGGIDPSVTNSVPSDIEIRHNYFFKPSSWYGATLNVKNLLEFKNGQRILVEGNILENCWPDGQNGYGFLITPRNQSGTAPWCVTQDITFRLNKLINCARGINMSGGDTNPGFTTQHSYRFLIENNFINVTGIDYSPAGFTNYIHNQAYIFGMGGGPSYVTVRHNTCFTTAVQYSGTGFQTNTPLQGDHYRFTDNICSYGWLGLSGDSYTGNNALNTYFSSYLVTKNAFIDNATLGSQLGIYPAGNYWATNNAAVGFTNFAGGDYSLTGASPYHNVGTDGTDLGANWTALNAATA